MNLYYFRLIENRVSDALKDTPVVLIAGPRQAGKTTLVKKMATNEMNYITLDDELSLLSAKKDPVGMIRNIDKGIIDEIQRAPQLLLAIKKSVDEDRRPGRFLLTGSANLMTLPTISDSLAGRMETLTLLPLSQCEIHGTNINWIDSIFEGKIPKAKNYIIGDSLVETVIRGGYPEALTRINSQRRNVWAKQYINSIIQRDVRDVATIEKLDQMPRFLDCLAHVSGQMCNYTQLGSQIGLDGKTVARYVGVLEQMYFLKRLDVWSKNRLKRIVKTPKLQFLDSGLLSTLCQVNFSKIKQDRSKFGSILETFVYSELLKQTTVSEGDYNLLYYRDVDKVEVDIVIENSHGLIVGVEIKASATVQTDDLKGLKKLAQIAGKHFVMGILLYDGQKLMPLGDGFWAVPISTLWGS